MGDQPRPPLPLEFGFMIAIFVFATQSDWLFPVLFPLPGERKRFTRAQRCKLAIIAIVASSLIAFAWYLNRPDPAPPIPIPKPTGLVFRNGRVELSP